MNKARPLLLERPGFFSAVRGGAGQRAAAGRGRGALCIAGRDAPQGCGRRAGHCKGVQRTLKSTQDTPRAGKGHPRAHKAPQSAWGTPQGAQGTPRTTGRTGHPRARRTPQSAQGHHSAGMGRTPEHTEYLRARRTPQTAQGHPRARRDTAECTGTLQSVQGHPRAQSGAGGLSAAEKRALRPPTEGGKRTFFCSAKKISNFLAKTVDKPLCRW